MNKVIITFICMLATAVAGAATPVLRINQTTVTDEELGLAQQALRLAGGATTPDATAGLRQALDQLIARALLLEAARAAGVTVDAAAAEQALRAQVARAGGEEAFARSLAEAKIDRATMLSILAERQAIARYVEEVLLAGVTISEADAEAYYRANPDEFRHPPQVRLRALLVAVSPHATPEAVAAAQRKAEEALRRIRQGEDFAAVAREVSSDRATELGWVPAGKLLPELEPAVWRLKPGEVSEVLRSPNGFHVFKAEARRGEGIAPFDEVRETLKGYLRQRAASQAVVNKVEELRAKAVIEGLTPEVKQALASPSGT